MRQPGRGSEQSERFPVCILRSGGPTRHPQVGTASAWAYYQVRPAEGAALQHADPQGRKGASRIRGRSPSAALRSDQV